MRKIQTWVVALRIVPGRKWDSVKMSESARYMRQRQPYVNVWVPISDSCGRTPPVWEEFPMKFNWILNTFFVKSLFQFKVLVASFFLCTWEVWGLPHSALLYVWQHLIMYLGHGSVMMAETFSTLHNGSHCGLRGQRPNMSLVLGVVRWRSFSHLAMFGMFCLLEIDIFWIERCKPVCCSCVLVFLRSHY